MIFLYGTIEGEELRKLIGAPAYIECSSKTQQVGVIFLAETVALSNYYFGFSY